MEGSLLCWRREVLCVDAVVEHVADLNPHYRVFILSLIRVLINMYQKQIVAIKDFKIP
jgi:hypothetical protein